MADINLEIKSQSQLSKKQGLGLILKGNKLTRLIIIIIILITGWFLFKNYYGPALKIGNTSISRGDYKVLIKQAAEQKVSKEDAKAQIIDAEKDIIVAKELNLTIDKDDIYLSASAKFNIYEPYKGLNEWQYLYGYSVAVKNALLNEKNGGYIGTYFAFPFSVKFDQTVTPQPTFPGFGDKTAIAKDKAYALQRANYYREQLFKSKISSSQALSEILKDKRLEYGGAANDSANFTFDKNGKEFTYGNSVMQIFNSVVVTSAKTLGSSGISKISPLYGDISMSPIPEYKGSGIHVGYYFVNLKSHKSPNSNIENQFNSQKDAIKVRENV